MSKKTYHVYKGHSLEDYNKKYSNKNYQVIKKEDADKNPSLLENKSWWLIGDQYYETPTSKCPPLSWWRNVNVVGKIITCVVGVGIVATAIAVPVSMSMNQTVEHTVEIKNGSLKNSKPKTLENGDLLFDLTCTDDTMEVAYITKITVGGVKLNYSEFVFDKENHTLTILNKALSKASADAKIVIEVVEKSKSPESIKVAAIRIKAQKDVSLLHIGETLQFTSAVKPSNATNPNVDWKLKFRSGEEGAAEISETGLLAAKQSGVVTVYATPKDDPTGSRQVVSNEIQVTIKVDVTDVALDKHEVTLLVESGVQKITATLSPQKVTDPNVNWYCTGDEGVIELAKETTVSGEENEFTPIGPGTVTLCACSNDNPDIYDTCTIKIELAESMIDWTKKVRFSDGSEASAYDLAKTVNRIYFDYLDSECALSISENATTKEAKIGETESDNIIARYVDTSEPGLIGETYLYILSDRKIVFEDDDLVQKDEGGLTGLFYKCYSAYSIEFNNFDSSKMTKMPGMFEDCSYLMSIDFSKINTSNVLDMSSMFVNCVSLNELDLSSLDTSNVKNMSSMFMGCSSLQSLNVTPLITTQVTDMSNMFSGCSSLNSINLKGFDTANVQFMDNMFYDCKNLTSLDVSSFNTAKVESMKDMFSATLDEMSAPSNLTTIYASDTFIVNDPKQQMFAGLTNLVGGEGTIWDESHICGDYARIDKGASDPGYFTLKLEPTMDKLNFEIDEETGLVVVSAAREDIEGEVIIPNEVDYYGELLPVNIVRGFSWCEGITSVHLPDSITKIDDTAFDFCSSLETINIPLSTVDIGERAFARDEKLKFKVPKTHSKYSTSFDDCCLLSDNQTALESFPSASGEMDLTKLESLQRIKPFAFYRTAVTNVIFPDSLTQIEYNAFLSSNLETIHITKNITSIGDSAFCACPNLRIVYIDSENIANYDDYANICLVEDSLYNIYNRTIYVKSEIKLSEYSSLLKTDHFEKQGTKDDYDIYQGIYKPEFEY